MLKRSLFAFHWVAGKSMTGCAVCLCVIFAACGYQPMNTVIETKCEWPSTLIVIQENAASSHRRKFSQMMKKHLLSPNHRSGSIRLQIRLMRDELTPSQFAADSTHLSARHHQEKQLDIIDGMNILWTKTLVNGLTTVRNAPRESIGYGQIEGTQENSYIEAAKRIEKELQTHCVLWSKKN